MAEQDEYTQIHLFGKTYYGTSTSVSFAIENEVATACMCGEQHTLILSKSGGVFCLGANDWGQLGLGHAKRVVEPTKLISVKESIKGAAGGRSHTLLLTEGGAVLACGSNEDLQLGTKPDIDDTTRPVPVAGLPKHPVTAICAGAEHSCALTANGHVYVWGTSTYGQLGLGKKHATAKQPKQVKIKCKAKKAVAISCGYYHTLVVMENGQVFGFGEGEGGKLGADAGDEEHTPIEIKGLQGSAVQVACGAGHSLVLTDKALYAFGDNSSGQLGLPENTFVCTDPTPVPLPADVEPSAIATIAAGEAHSALTTRDGRMYATGSTRHSAVGVEPSAGASAVYGFTRVDVGEGFSVQSVACGACHTAAVALWAPTTAPSVATAAAAAASDQEEDDTNDDDDDRSDGDDEGSDEEADEVQTAAHDTNEQEQADGEEGEEEEEEEKEEEEEADDDDDDDDTTTDTDSDGDKQRDAAASLSALAHEQGAPGKEHTRVEEQTGVTATMASAIKGRGGAPPTLQPPASSLPPLQQQSHSLPASPLAPLHSPTTGQAGAKLPPLTPRHTAAEFEEVVHRTAFSEARAERRKLRSLQAVGRRPLPVLDLSSPLDRPVLGGGEGSGASRHVRGSGTAEAKPAGSSGSGGDSHGVVDGDDDDDELSVDEDGSEAEEVGRQEEKGQAAARDSSSKVQSNDVTTLSLHKQGQGQQQQQQEEEQEKQEENHEEEEKKQQKSPAIQASRAAKGISQPAPEEIESPQTPVAGKRTGLLCTPRQSRSVRARAQQSNHKKSSACVLS